MTEFNVGDRVRRISCYSSDHNGMRIGDEDTVTKNDSFGLILSNYGSGHTATRFELVKGIKPSKPDNMIHYLAYGTGCNNKSNLMSTEAELKEKLKKVVNDSQWTGRIIGYKLTPILEAQSKVVLSVFKVPTVKKVK